MASIGIVVGVCELPQNKNVTDVDNRVDPTRSAVRSTLDFVYSKPHRLSKCDVSFLNLKDSMKISRKVKFISLLVHEVRNFMEDICGHSAGYNATHLHLIQ
jgi:hypothetical protein